MKSAPLVLRTSLLIVVCFGLCMLHSSLHAITSQNESAIRALKLTQAQQDAIREVVTSFPKTVERQVKKITQLKKDLSIAQRENTISECKKILLDIATSKAEIQAVALDEMQTICKGLTATQEKKLQELRQGANRETEMMENSTSNNFSSFSRTFSFSSNQLNLDNAIFNPDEVFTYPERELWIDGNGNSMFEMFFGNASSNDTDVKEYDDGTRRPRSLQGLDTFEDFFNNFGDDAKRSFPQLRKFIERMPQNDTNSDPNNEDRNDSYRNDPQFKNDKKTPPQFHRKNNREKINPDEMQLKLQELQKRMNELEKEMQNKKQ